MIYTPSQAKALVEAAIRGHEMEHGVPPSFILLSVDVARGLKAYMTYQIGELSTAADPAPKFHGIEIARVEGVGRVELVTDLVAFKERYAAKGEPA